MDYFNYCQGLTMTNRRFHDLFGGPPRPPESPLEQRHMDLAASIQAVTEEIVLRIGRDLHASTGHEAPGPGRRRRPQLRRQRPAAARGAVRRSSGFSRPPATPAAPWARPCSSGTSSWTSRASPSGRDAQKGSLLGPQFTHRRDRSSSSTSVERDRISASPTRPSLLEHVAGLLAEERSSAGSRAGWSSARERSGRAASWAIRARRAMQATMNLKIKFRESFRPFAPCVLQEHAPEWFDIEPGQESPYMLLVAPVRRGDSRAADRPRRSDAHADDPDLRAAGQRGALDDPGRDARRLQCPRADRGRGAQPALHRLLQAFERPTGCPVLVNTSFNVRGEPIVCTPEDAFRCFLATDMDVLVLEDLSSSRTEDAAAPRCRTNRARIPRPVPARLTREESHHAMVRHPVRPPDEGPSAFAGTASFSPEESRDTRPITGWRTTVAMAHGFYAVGGGSVPALLIPPALDRLDYIRWMGLAAFTDWPGHRPDSCSWSTTSSMVLLTLLVASSFASY